MNLEILNPNTLVNICRLCLTEPGGIDIFENCFLHDNIFSITGIKVQHLDNFPNKLCKNCFEIIQLTVEFRDSVAKCQEILHDIVKEHFDSELTTSNGSSEQVTPIEEIIIKDDDCNLVVQQSNECKNQPVIRVRNDLYPDLKTNDVDPRRSKLNSIRDSNTSRDKEKEPIEIIASNIKNNDVHNEPLKDNFEKDSSDVSYTKTSTTHDSMEIIIICPSADERENAVELSRTPQKTFNKEAAHNDKQNNQISTRPLIEIINAESDKQKLRTEHNTTNNMQKNNEQKGVGDASSYNVVSMELPNDILKKELDKQAAKEPLGEENFEENKNPSKKIKFEDDSTYKCDVCSKFFVTQKKLYFHKRVHNKVYQCTVERCNKMFATKGDLQKHSRTHTGERPFSCSVCGRKFTQKVLLKSHRESIHGVKLETMSEEQLTNNVLWDD